MRRANNYTIYIFHHHQTKITEMSRKLLRRKIYISKDAIHVKQHANKLDIISRVGIIYKL